jgi:hypothetical protein
MLFGIQLAILAIFATPAFPQGLGAHYVDPGPNPPTVPSVWMYWGECYLYAEMFLTCVDDNGKEAYTPGGDDGWRLDSGCHLNLIDYDGIWIEKDPRPRDRTGCAYAYENERCCGKPQPIELAFSRKYLIRDLQNVALCRTGDGETRTVFADAGLPFAGKSFDFSNVSYSLRSGGNELTPRNPAIMTRQLTSGVEWIVLSNRLKICRYSNYWSDLLYNVSRPLVRIDTCVHSLVPLVLTLMPLNCMYHPIVYLFSLQYTP